MNLEILYLFLWKTVSAGFLFMSMVLTCKFAYELVMNPVRYHNNREVRFDVSLAVLLALFWTLFVFVR